MNKLFIVNDPDTGSRVITKGVLVADIKNCLVGKVRSKDVEQYAEEMLTEHVGQAMSADDYCHEMSVAAEVIGAFSNLTAYQYCKLINKCN